MKPRFGTPLNTQHPLYPYLAGLWPFWDYGRAVYNTATPTGNPVSEELIHGWQAEGCKASPSSPPPTWNNDLPFGPSIYCNDATYQYLLLGDPAEWRFTGAHSLLWWGRIDGLPAANSSGLIDKDCYTSGSYGSGIRLDHTGYVSAIWAANATTLDYVSSAVLARSNPLPDMFVAIFSPSTAVRVYQNGVKVAEKTSGIPAAFFNNNSLPWCSMALSNTQWWTKGHVLALGMFSKALSDAEALDLYANFNKLWLPNNRAHVAVYSAMDLTTAGGATGDAANQTIQRVNDGLQPRAITAAPYEIGNGYYGVSLTADENCGKHVVVQGSSSTGNVRVDGAEWSNPRDPETERSWQFPRSPLGQQLNPATPTHREDVRLLSSDGRFSDSTSDANPANGPAGVHPIAIWQTVVYLPTVNKYAVAMLNQACLPCVALYDPLTDSFSDWTTFTDSSGAAGAEHGCPSLGIDPWDDALVVYYGSWIGNQPIQYYRRALPPYDTWDAEQSLADTDRRWEYPSAFAHPDGKTYLWVDGDTAGTDPYTYHFVNDAGEWSARTLVIQASVFDYRLVRMDATGRFHIFWCLGSGSRIWPNREHLFYMRSNTGATAWAKADGTALTLPVSDSTCEKVLNVLGYCNVPSGDMRFDSGNNPMAVIPMNGNIVFIRHTGSAWTAPVTVAPAAHGFCCAHLTRDSDTHLRVLCMCGETRSGGVYEYQSTDQGVTWVLLRRIFASGCGEISGYWGTDDASRRVRALIAGGPDGPGAVYALTEDRSYMLGVDAVTLPGTMASDYSKLTTGDVLAQAGAALTAYDSNGGVAKQSVIAGMVAGTTPPAAGFFDNQPDATVELSPADVEAIGTAAADAVDASTIMAAFEANNSVYIVIRDV